MFFFYKNKDYQQEKAVLLKEISVRILHKFLICLGDLARYQTEYDFNGSPKLAEKYYKMSLILMPSKGMPLNQLGTLYGSKNYGCDAAYYYLYCLTCTKPFMSARENLKLLFLKNRKRFDEIKSKNYLDRTRLAEYELDEIKVKEIKKFIVLFLYVVEMILEQSSHWSSNSTKATSINQIDNLKLQELCQLCLQEFNSCMFYQKSDNKNPSFDQLNNETKLTYLSDDLVFKLTVIILMTIEQLKSQKVYLLPNSNAQSFQNKPQMGIYFTSVAFALLFFSHILNHTCIRFQAALYGANKIEKISEAEEARDKVNLDDDSEKKSATSNEASKKTTPKNSKSNKSKKKISLLYARRRFVARPSNF